MSATQPVDIPIRGNVLPCGKIRSYCYFQ